MNGEQPIQKPKRIRKPKPPTGNPPGRPPFEPNWIEFDKLCGLQCTLVEFACYFGVSEDCIIDAVKRTHGVEFYEYFKVKRGNGKIALRRAQFAKALEGNPALLIWLGKQYLDQSEKFESKADTIVRLKHDEIATLDDSALLDAYKNAICQGLKIE